MANRVAGIISFKINGEQYNAKGSFKYGYGKEARTTIIGVDNVHGYSTQVQAAFIDGEITDDGELSVDKLAALVDDTVTLDLGNGKIFALYNAWSTNPDGVQGNTDESNIAVRFEGKRAKEVRA